MKKYFPPFVVILGIIIFLGMFGIIWFLTNNPKKSLMISSTISGAIVFYFGCFFVINWMWKSYEKWRNS